MTPSRPEGPCVWIHSDLQLRDPQVARETLARAVNDLKRQNLNLEGVWCLGDCTVGNNLPEIGNVAQDVATIVDQLGVPVCYVQGNHEMDTRRRGTHSYPMYELARARAGWRTMEQLSDFYFAAEFCGYRVYFFGDHADVGGTWWTTHGKVCDDPDGAYPHLPEGYRRLREEIAASKLPVLTASHYAYPGGQRPSALQQALLPLPSTVRAHFYGHAHIGDFVHNKERPLDRELSVDDSETLQYNISALETRRSSGSHSCILEFHPHAGLQLHVRCHLDQRWTERFVIERPQVRAAM